MYRKATKEELAQYQQFVSPRLRTIYSLINDDRLQETASISAEIDAFCADRGFKLTHSGLRVLK